MPEQSKQLYHCDRCGEIFKSTIKETSEILCTECGKSPVRDGFAQLAQLPTLDHSLLDTDHGIAGKDEADFFSIQKEKKQKRALVMYGCWFALLIMTMGVGYYVKKTHDEKEEERESINKETNDYIKRQDRAQLECMRVFNKFALSRGENAQALSIFNGTDYLVDIKRYYSNPINIVDYKSKKLVVTKSKLTENEGSLDRMDLLVKIDYADRYDTVFELVFWKQDDEWKLDWPQFVRLGDGDWGAFVKEDGIVGDYQFRLYARKRRNLYNEDNGYTELVFSKAVNEKDKSSDDSVAVLVKNGTELERDLLEFIEEVYQRQLPEDEVLGVIDTSGQSRVNVRVGYTEVNGERVPIVKELLAKDWFSTMSKTDSVKIEPAPPTEINEAFEDIKLEGESSE